jgi:hypothetical protein
MATKIPMCTGCGGSGHYKTFCHRTAKRVPRATKRPRQQSDKEMGYQRWKELTARPYLIQRDGNRCSCCKREAHIGEKLDIEHTLTKGSRPDLKRDLDNLTLMCRWPCHDNKTNNRGCVH